MKNDIKNNDNCLRQDYVPASVKVINVTARRVLCESPNEYNMDPTEMENQNVF